MKGAGQSVAAPDAVIATCPMRPERAAYSVSKQIRFVVLYTIFFQECKVFLLEIRFVMVLFLGLDVSLGSLHDGLTDGEATIPTLPSEVLIVFVLGLDPSAAMAFHIFHQFGQSDVFRHDAQDMNMVFYTSNLDGSAVQRVENLSDICMQLCIFLFADWHTRIFDVKGGVDV